jgi:hypothetical protein
MPPALLDPAAAGAFAATPTATPPAMKNVYDSFCGELGGGRLYCATQGACFDPLTEDCREPGFVPPTGLPVCVRGAEASCAKRFTGPSKAACEAGAQQSQRAPALLNSKAAQAVIQFPGPFAVGNALGAMLCTNF